MIPGLMNSTMFLTGGGALNVADVFKTHLWTSGGGASETIVTGVDLLNNDGFLWTKNRTSAGGHIVTTGAIDGKYMAINGTNVATTSTHAPTFNDDGFDIGSDFNPSGKDMVAWNFIKAAGFFDVVEYTGTGVAQNIAHDLGSVPGMIIVKRTDTTGSWFVYHRSNTANPETEYLLVNTSQGTNDNSIMWDYTAPTSSVFTVGTYSEVNASGGTFIALIFAHDDSADGIIQCGSYTGNGSTSGPTITTGHETQWLLIKRTDSTGDWRIYDNVRDATNPRTYKLLANSGAAEDTAGEDIDFNSTNFQIKSSDAGINASGGTYIYVEIKAAA